MTDETDLTSPPYEPLDGSLEVVVETTMAATGRAIYEAWTKGLDTWFAAAGRLWIYPSEGEPFWFETEYEGTRHPHYGKFLKLIADRLIEMTWVTGKDGTWGAETIVRVEITDEKPGSKVRLTHRGFYDASSAQQHAQAWPQVLAHLNEVLSAA